MARSLNITWEDPLAAQRLASGVRGEHHYNPIGVVHGGLAMTLLDSAMGCCVHTRLAAGTGKVIHPGGRTATAEGRIGGRRGQALRPRHNYLHHPRVKERGVLTAPLQEERGVLTAPL